MCSVFKAVLFLQSKPWYTLGLLPYTARKHGQCGSGLVASSPAGGRTWEHRVFRDPGPQVPHRQHDSWPSNFDVCPTKWVWPASLTEIIVARHAKEPGQSGMMRRVDPELCLGACGGSGGKWPRCVSRTPEECGQLETPADGGLAGIARYAQGEFRPVRLRCLHESFMYAGAQGSFECGIIDKGSGANEKPSLTKSRTTILVSGASFCLRVIQIFVFVFVYVLFKSSCDARI